MKNRIFHIARRALRPLKSKRAQTLVEYALILAFISIVAIGVLVHLSSDINNLYSSIHLSFTSAQASH